MQRQVQAGGRGASEDMPSSNMPPPHDTAHWDFGILCRNDEFSCLGFGVYILVSSPEWPKSFGSKTGSETNAGVRKFTMDKLTIISKERKYQIHSLTSKGMREMSGRLWADGK